MLLLSFTPLLLVQKSYFILVNVLILCSLPWLSSQPDFYKLVFGLTYRWHNSLALKSPPHSVVDTFRFPPACVNAFVGVALVTIEALWVCADDKSVSQLRLHPNGTEFEFLG